MKMQDYYYVNLLKAIMGGMHLSSQKAILSGGQQTRMEGKTPLKASHQQAKQQNTIQGRSH